MRQSTILYTTHCAYLLLSPFCLYFMVGNLFSKFISVNISLLNVKSCFHHSLNILGAKKLRISALKEMSSIACKKFKDDIPKHIYIGTHDGTFHCDEALGCFMLKLLPNYKNAEIIRTRNPDILKTCDIVIDVGAQYKPEENLFDHHQITFNETFSSLRPEHGDKLNIRLSSAGLIYTHFGEQVIAQILKTEKQVVLSEDELQLLFVTIYENFMREIDAIDNGVPMFDDEPKFYISTDISSRVARINSLESSTDTVPEPDELFRKAMSLVGSEFVERVVFYGTHWISARKHVKKALQNAKNVHHSGEIIELETFCPWKTHLFSLENELGVKGLCKFVLSSSNSEDWRVIGVPLNPKSFICRKFLRKSWWGIRSDELAIESDVKDAVFVHSTGFIGGARSRDGVLQMAIKSLDENEINK